MSEPERRYLETHSGGRLRLGGVHYGGLDSKGHWSAPTTPTFADGYEHEDDHDHHHGKKSVFTRVKERAKKLRQMLSKKKHGHSEDNSTPPWGVSLDEEDEEDDPEYHGAPMYESETAPSNYKETSIHRQPPTRCLSEKLTYSQPYNGVKETETMQTINTHKKPATSPYVRAVKETTIPQGSAIPPPAIDNPELKDKPTQQNSDGRSDSSKTLTAAVTDVLAPAYNKVSEATQMIALKIQAGSGSAYEAGAKQVWDKGISVKEYLMQKLEPGEDDRALCQVITEAVSPRNGGQGQGGMGAMEKVKGAVTSLLGKEQAEQQPQGSSVSGSAKPNGSPIPVSTKPGIVSTKPRGSPIPVSAESCSSPIPASAEPLSSPIPVSTNPYAEEVEARRLQAYTN